MKRINYRLKEFIKIALLFFVLNSVLSCKSTKAIAATGKVSKKLSSKQLIKAHKKSFSTFKTLQSKAKIELKQGDKSQGATFNLRIEKDKTIWLSAPFNFARLKITPNNVKFYNKGDNTYFDGNYKLLSNFVGFDLDFNKVQNILLGQAIYNLNKKAHKIDTQNNSYVLSPEQQDVILELFYLMNASHFKLNSLQLAQQSKQRFLQIDYKSYQNISKQVLPKEIKIVAVEGTKQVGIDMEIKSVKLNEDLRFPFKVPSGFKKIEL